MGNPDRKESGSEVFIKTLNTLGVDHIFLNPGIDLVPILAAISKYRSAGKKHPKVILCTDESVAVAAAHGYAMVSNKPQVVMVFEDIGILQGGGAIVNLQYGRIPVILCSGRKAIPNRINWQKEPFDQGKIVRDYVKWDYEVRPTENISSALHQAYEIASEEPCGPVYLAIDGEILTGKNGRASVTSPIKKMDALKAERQKNEIQRAAEILLLSENPLILTAYSGRNPHSVDLLVELAETLAARVITTDLRMNFPSTHPLCPGIDCIKGDSYDHYISEADVLFLLDYNFPGPLGKRFEPKPDAQIIHFDMEPQKQGNFLWDREPDILIEGNSVRLLHELNGIIRQGVSVEQDTRFCNRFKRLTEEHRELRAKWRQVALEKSNKRPISPEWLCHCINEILLNEETIIVHQLPSNADAMSHHILRSKAGTLFCWGEGAGSMGWALPAALGAKLASPGKTVVSLIGDGGFIYGCPVATLWGASAYNAPFLSIIFNNHSYAIFKEVMQMFYGATISGNQGFELGFDIKNPPDFAMIARGCNAYGRRVEDPEELLPALKTAISHVQDGTPAVLDVIICR